MRFIDKLRKRWGVGPWGVLAIMLSFALAGSTVVRLRAPVMRVLVPADASGWHRWGVYVLVLVPLYQILLFGYASLLGQYGFFRKRLAVMGRGIVHLARWLRAERRDLPGHDAQSRGTIQPSPRRGRQRGTGAPS